MEHEPSCPYFQVGIKRVRDQKLKGLMDSVARIDKLTDRLGALAVGGALNHEVANIRFSLIAEAVHLRDLAHQFKVPLDKATRFSQQGGAR